MPPTKIFVATVVDKLEIVTITYQRAIDREIFEPDFVCRFLVVPREGGTRILRVGHGRDAHATSIPKLKQSSFNLNHAVHVLSRSRRSSHRRIELIAEQML